MAEKVVGRIPVLECLRAKTRKAHRLFALRNAKGLEAIRRAAAGIPVTECSRAELNALAAGLTHQGAVLEADPLPVHRAEQWLKGPFSAEAVVVVLDGVEDPHNFGAIVRSCAACGAVGVMFAKDRAAPISPIAVKSAAGAMEHVALVRATNLVRALDGLKNAGFWVVGLEAQAPQDIWSADLSGRLALVVGSEGKGIRRLVRDRCDLTVRIPLAGPISSLNVSVSAGIALAYCQHRRTSS